MAGLSRKISLIRTLSLLRFGGRRPSAFRALLSSGVSASPSKNVLMPISFKPASMTLLPSKSALKESRWGRIAAANEGNAVWSFGGFLNSWCRRMVSKSTDQLVSVAEGAIFERIWALRASFSVCLDYTRAEELTQDFQLHGARPDVCADGKRIGAI